jgi:two-component system, chemotaxis family, sensor kinase CheA
MEAIDEIVAEFLVESHENLDQLDTDLLALEQDPNSRELLAGVFRTIHTIKGTSGFLAFHRLEQLTHVGENLLSRLRDGKIALTEERTSALLNMVDTVRELLRTIEETGQEGNVEVAELTALLGTLKEDGGVQPGAEPVSHVAEALAEAAEEIRGDGPSADSDDAPAGEAAAPAAEETASGEEGRPVEEPKKSGKRKSVPPVVPAPGKEPIGQILVGQGSVQSDEVELAAIQQGLGDERPLGQILVENKAATPAAVSTALETQEGQTQEARRSVVESSVRVDVDLLDTLMRMVGELVLARNQLVSELDEAKDTALARSAQRLSLVTSELQEQVMKTRMQPIDTVWSKLPRVVRDLARQCGRTLRLEMEGRDTELDRSILEAIKDPLTHLVRNAVDHGVETPERRVATGKDPEGVITLRAYHEAGQVHLEIKDDGAGIDPEIIGRKAVERGLVTQTQLNNMSKREITQMIFAPGFSTAAAVTNVSGRGVGMDVVKTRIESIGGSVDVISTPGAGSTFRLTIPLTLAIIPALTIGCAGRRYAVPQVSVLELVRLAGEHARGGIELISGAPVYRLRGTLMPLVRLDEQLGLVPAGSHETTPNGQPKGPDGDGRGGFIVVLQAEQHRFGLVVDDVLDTQEIVVKPLGRHLKNIPLYAGATILGDGSVVLILDATTIARRADVLSNAHTAATSGQTDDMEQIDPMLVVELAGGRQAAVPLSVVTRLEEIPSSSIEQVGGREVVQYRGRIMPLVRIASLLGAYGDGSQSDTVQLVVYTREGRSVGFVVDRILDIATERPGTRSDIDDTSLIGSVVVGDRVVELLDVESAVRAADPTFYDESGPDPMDALQDIYETAADAIGAH